MSPWVLPVLLAILVFGLWYGDRYCTRDDDRDPYLF